MDYDMILRDGTLYDGRGGPGVRGDLAIQGQSIAALGDLRADHGRQELALGGLAVAPGFINMLSWATESLIADGRSQSDIRQGVTLEVMGEGFSFGPLNDEMKATMRAEQGDIKFDVSWTTLDEYLEHLVARGVSCNVASFVGASTVRIHTIGYAARSPSAAELEAMCDLVRQAMRDGAMGLASALIYAPDCFYKTGELVALAAAAAEYDGLYISHLRSEGNAWLEALDELITIARQAHIRAEVYHLKAAGRDNWPKLDAAIAKIEAAQAEGLAITADMYHYTAGATGLDATMPRWVQEGGNAAWVARLKDPAIRARLRREMNTPSSEWENMFLGVGTPDNILFLAFKNDALKHYTGQTLAQVAAARGTSPEDTIFDLVIEDDSRVGTAFFMMSEENVRRQVALPWCSVDSDEASLAPEGVFLKSNAHPRAYGTFARYLGKYVRDEQVIPLGEALRKLTSLPAGVLKLDRRGLLEPGYYADLAIFDPAKIQDHATFAQPHQYATGMVHVFVNGAQVLRDGEHTGATPGMVVHGPGRKAVNG
jgi:N-acyl-D-amino-acid deacylase